MQRYNNLSLFLKRKYGEKVYKLPVDGGFTCPNRKNGGCIFCSEEGAGEFTSRGKTITAQLEEQKRRLEKKKAKKFIAYFQSFTNTYAPVDRLREKYREALSVEDVIGLSVATRADCLGEDVLDLLEEIGRDHLLWVELGVQSVKEETIRRINRGYSHKLLQEKMKELKDRKITTIAHIIYGLPGETDEDFFDTVRGISEEGFDGVKFHSLYLQEDIPLYKEYKKGNFSLPTKENYVKAVARAIGMLPQEMIVHRLTGDPDKSKTFYPKWTGDKLGVIGAIQKELKEQNIVQKENNEKENNL